MGLRIALVVIGIAAMADHLFFIAAAMLCVAVFLALVSKG